MLFSFTLNPVYQDSGGDNAYSLIILHDGLCNTCVCKYGWDVMTAVVSLCLLMIMCHDFLLYVLKQFKTVIILA